MNKLIFYIDNQSRRAAPAQRPATAQQTRQAHTMPTRQAAPPAAPRPAAPQTAMAPAAAPPSALTQAAPQQPGMFAQSKYTCYSVI